MDSINSQDNLHIANTYILNGFSVVPLWKSQKYVHAEDYDSLMANTTNEDRARLIAKRDDGIGLELNNLVVVDIDTNDEDAFNSLLLRLNITKDYIGISKTKDGWHIWFRTMFDCEQFFCENSIELKSKNYCPVYPSLHPEGGQYTWFNKSIPEYDELLLLTSNAYNWLLSIRKKKSTIKYGAEEGGRNQTLTELVGLLAAKDINVDIISTLAKAHNQVHINPPLPEKEIDTIVRSIVKSESQKDKVEVESAKFELLNLHDFIEQFGVQDDTWILDRFIPNSACGTIISPPELGKTWLLLDMAISMATGKPFLNSIKPTRTGEIWLIQQEDQRQALLQRLRLLLGCRIIEDSNDCWYVEFPASDIPIKFYTEKSFNMENQEILDDFASQIRDKQPMYVFIDPFYAIGNPSDHFASTAVKMKLFKQLRDEVGTGFLIAHHTARQTENRGRERDAGLGSQLLNAWVEFGIQLSQKEGKTVIHRNFKTDAKPEDVEFVMEFTDFNCNLSIKPIVVTQATPTTYEDDSKDDDTLYLDTLRVAISQSRIKTLNDVCALLNLSNANQGKRLLDKLSAKKVEGVYVCLS